MSTKVALSDALVREARQAGKTADRSIAGQVEVWARLGRVVYLLLDGEQASKLCDMAAARPLSACLADVDTPTGRKQVGDYLESQPFPHYKPHPRKRGVLERMDEDGTRTAGRFVGRRFKPSIASEKTGSRAKTKAGE